MSLSTKIFYLIEQINNQMKKKLFMFYKLIYFVVIIAENKIVYSVERKWVF